MEETNEMNHGGGGTSGHGGGGNHRDSHGGGVRLRDEDAPRHGAGVGLRDEGGPRPPVEEVGGGEAGVDGVGADGEVSGLGDGDDALVDDVTVLPDGGDESGHAHGVGKLHGGGGGGRETTRLSSSLHKIKLR